MTWGSSFGAGWGGGGPSSLSSGAFTVESVYVRTSLSFVVVFSQRPILRSPVAAADASNLKNVVLTDVETNKRCTVMRAAAAAENVNAVVYYALRHFSAHTYRVSFSNLVSASGNPLATPSSGTFVGTPAVFPRPLGNAAQDLLNHQASGDLLNAGLVVGADGDYAKESGAQLLKKLILRRLVTAQGEFFHLADTSYGAGLRVKNLIRPSELVPLQVFVADQIRLEPEITDSVVSLSLGSKGVLTIQVQAKLRYSNSLTSITIPVQTGVQL